MMSITERFGAGIWTANIAWSSSSRIANGPTGARQIEGCQRSIPFGHWESRSTVVCMHEYCFNESGSSGTCDRVLELHFGTHMEIICTVQDEAPFGNFHGK